MAQLHLKYNPGFIDDADLIRLFVVRQTSLDFILRTIDENTGPSTQHVLLVGSRGTGKTTLVRRVAAEIRMNPKYSGWFPVIFAEESYEVSTPGEFWLEALFRLADQTKSNRWCEAYQEIKLETDDVRVRERALAQLLDFATEQGKRILLIVENLNMLLGEQLSDRDAWDLRHTLVNEPRIMVLGTAVTRFSKITNSGKPWFELFAVHTLKPLIPEECSVLWRAITDNDLPSSQMRPIQILTGGNPRLIGILAEFAHKNSFRDLMNDLIHLVDEHTEFFKSQLDTLAALERKVFVGLLDLWDPASARAVARHARMPVSTTSAYLNRLVSRGAVSVLEASRRKKLYQSAERLYNIYYLMRKRGHPSNRVRAAVRFMVQFYQGTELVESAARLAQEACRLAPRLRADHYIAYEDIVRSCARELQSKIVKATPGEFFDSADAPQSVRELLRIAEFAKLGEAPKDEARYGLPPSKSEMVDVLLWAGQDLQKKEGASPKVEQLFRKAVEIDPENGHAWGHLGFFLYQDAKRLADGRDALERAVQFSPNDSWSWIHLGKVRTVLGLTEGAEEAYRRVVELRPQRPPELLQLGHMLHRVGRYSDAERIYEEVVQKAGGANAAEAWLGLGELYQYHLYRYKEAEQAYKTSLTIKREPLVLLQLGHLLTTRTGREPEAATYYREAEELYTKRIERHPKDADSWMRLGEILKERADGKRAAETAFAKAVDLQGPRSSAWPFLLETRLGLGEGIGTVVGQAEKFLNARGRDAGALHQLARGFFDSGRSDALTAAERLAREAVERSNKGDWSVIHTLTIVLAEQGKWEEALSFAGPVFDAAANSELAVRFATGLAISAGSAGFAGDILNILGQSKGRPALEPLEVGLRKFLNESPVTAQEISEVANDIVEQIRAKQASTSTAANKPE
jgi:tetratricopeptide (TPR) repeat protein